MSPTALHRFSRFTLVGLANTLAYAAATWVYVDVWGLSATVGGSLGYATAVPIAFWGHRELTFQVQGAARPQFVRFISTHALGLLLATAITWLVVDLWGGPLWVGIVATIFTVPVATYIVMDRWVFRIS